MMLKPIPKINVGMYSGTPIDQLPTSYCRWMLSQDFPEDWLLIAKEKVEASQFYDEHISVTRHALDQFSLRFMSEYISNLAGRHDKPDGFATYVAKRALVAWERGKDVSKRRHPSDGTVKLFDGKKWVFQVSQRFPEYKDLITVMP